MTICRRVLALAALGFACLAGTSVRASGPTDEELALQMAHMRIAPLAVSGDGQWLVYQDGKRVLHRQNRADPRQAQSLALPLDARSLAASSSAGVVAFTTRTGCIGVVTFAPGVAAKPVFKWAPGAGPDAFPPDRYETLDPKTREPRLCGGLGTPALALSEDGRLLATSSQVVDLRSGAVLATLPGNSMEGGHREILQLRFLDQARQLLLLSATLGEGYESPSTPSDRQFSIWDLKTGALRQLISEQDAKLTLAEAFFFDFSPRSKLLYRVMPGAEDAPLALVQQPLAACKSKPAARFLLKADAWKSLLADPHGRWIAAIRTLGKAAGEELAVFDLASRRQVGSLRVKTHLRGLAASPDGATIYGLESSMPDPFSGEALPSGGALRSYAVNTSLLSTPSAAAAGDVKACAIEDETPSARSVQSSGRLLAPLWTVPMKAAGEIPVAAQSCEDSNGKDIFVKRDGTLWINRIIEAIQLDPLSGQAKETQSLPRIANACTVPAFAARGFVSWQGDTVSWRPFGESASRRLVDRRPGWYAREVSTEDQRIKVVWARKPGEEAGQQPGQEPATDADGRQIDLHVAYYDIPAFRRLRDRAMSSDEYDYEGDNDPRQAARADQPCIDAEGKAITGYDWRLSHFDSFRGYACDAGAARTVFWDRIDIAPGRTPSRAVLDHDRQIGVARDGATLRVYDIAARRELGRIALPDPGAARAVHVIAALRLVLVETWGAPDLGADSRLQAYAF